MRLVENERAIVEFDNVVKHFDRIMSLLTRKCKRRCSMKRVLEEYCAFRLGALYFERHYKIRFGDETGLVRYLEEIVRSF